MKKIPKLKRSLDLGEYGEMVRSLENESDRGAAVIAGSFVEHYLKDFLTSFLVRDKVPEDLFDGTLASFAARAKMCYSINLINISLLEDLDIIRLIRNHFAHHPIKTSFSDKDVKGLCSEFSLAKAFWGEGRTFMREHGPRQTYLFSVGTCLEKMEKGRIAHRKGQFKVLGGFTNPTWGERKS